MVVKDVKENRYDSFFYMFDERDEVKKTFDFNFVFSNLQKKSNSTIKIVFKGNVFELKDHFYLLLSTKKPIIKLNQKLIFGLGISLTRVPFLYWTEIPAKKELSEDIILIKLSEFDGEISIPEGEYYATFLNGEIEEDSLKQEFEPFSIKWNKGFFASFGYEYNYEKHELEEYKSEVCVKKSIPNIHNLGKLYDPRGINQYSCPKIILKANEKFEINLEVENEKKHPIRTLVAWFPGILLFAPIFYGSTIQSVDYKFDAKIGISPKKKVH